MTEMTYQRPNPRGDHRILYVSDPSTIARTVLPDPVREADLRKWVDMIADSGIDMFNQEIFSQGWTVYWQSEHYEYDQRPQHQRFRPLIEAGHTAPGYPHRPIAPARHAIHRWLPHK